LLYSRWAGLDDYGVSTDGRGIVGRFISRRLTRRRVFTTAPRASSAVATKLRGRGWHYLAAFSCSYSAALPVLWTEHAAAVTTSLPPTTTTGNNKQHYGAILYFPSHCLTSGPIPAYHTRFRFARHCPLLAFVARLQTGIPLNVCRLPSDNAVGLLVPTRISWCRECCLFCTYCCCAHARTTAVWDVIRLDGVLDLTAFCLSLLFIATIPFCR